jgi:SAM-dependent methyltransferase
MHQDVIDLRSFYHTPLGQVARRTIRRQLRGLWPNVSRLSVLGLGYATPFLGLFAGEAAQIAAVMPAQQGVVPWPRDGRNLTVLAEEDALPLPDLSVDRMLIVHGLEVSEKLRPMLREVWRVLSGNGRLIVVAPNRTGLWSRTEATPFGHGRPYSMSQLDWLLRDFLFVPELRMRALFVPPLQWGVMLRTAAAWEKIGSSAFDRFGGVNIVEATKQIYAMPAPRRAKVRGRLLPVPQNGGDTLSIEGRL